MPLVNVVKQLIGKKEPRRNSPCEVPDQPRKQGESQADAIVDDDNRLLFRGPATQSRSKPNSYPWPFDLDSQGRPLPNSVEDHLLKRSRRTVTWDRFDGHDNALVDKSSIVDQRKLVRFESYLDGDSVALAPPTVDIGDRLVILRGARLSFAVRVLNASDRGDGTVTREVLLLGECLINGFEKYDSVLKPNVVKEEEFVFV
jgi:hypothetical protein